MCSLEVFSVTPPPRRRISVGSKFQDPIEQAFTLDVPKGWTVKGGLFRLGYSDARAMVDLKSPDGRINVRLEDVSIPSYAIPNQLHSGEGKLYDLGAQAQMTVAKYRSGQEYASVYAQSRFKTPCASLTPQSGDAAAAPHQSSDGQASYRCGSGIAYVYAKTFRYPALWVVHTTGSLLAPADQVSAARAVLDRCAQSFWLSPEWIEH